MKKRFIIIALLSVCFCNAEAKEQKKEEPAAPPQTATTVCDSCDFNKDKFNDITKKYEALSEELVTYKTEAKKYVAPLMEISNSTTSLTEFDIKKAKEAIALYEKGAKVVEIVIPCPEFDAPAAVEQLRKRVEVATEVQNACNMLSRKYTAKENDDAKAKLTAMSQYQFLTEDEKTLCKELAGNLTTDMELRGEFVTFLNKFYADNALIPHRDAAAVAYQDFKTSFVTPNFGGGGVPETYALVHDIVGEMTKTLTNYKGSLDNEAKFKAWINKFVKQLSTK